jgi:formylglycine-generating enzyme required for sulfatase activity
MRRSIFGWLTLASVALLLDFSAGGRAQEPKKVLPDPTPRIDAILKLFVEEFVPVTPGKGKFAATYLMGSPTMASAQPVHAVKFGYSFDMARYEVTQELYHVVMGKNPSKWLGLRNSAEMMSWAEANEFCKKATAELHKRKLIAADEEIRLPTEAEWEYCCRAGSKTDYSFGDDVKKIGDYVWYKDNSKGHDPPVGAKKPNAWGLHEMHGYVWEWCADDYQAGYKDAPTDGSARKVAGAKEKVIRGGSYATPAEECQSAFRGHIAADTRSDTIGFRCVRAKKGGGNG